MIRIREKDILFIAINLAMFFSFCSHWFMEVGLLGAAGMIQTPEPTIAEGYIYLLYSFGGISLILAGLITFFIDIWWLYRMIRQYQKGYWTENL